MTIERMLRRVGVAAPTDKGLAVVSQWIWPSTQRAWPFATVIVVAFVCAWHVNKIRPERHRSSDVVAQVGARSVNRAELEDAVGGLMADLQPHPSSQMRSEVLRKLIDEELLYQDGIALGLPETDPVVRLAIVRAMIVLADRPGPEAVTNSTSGRAQVPNAHRAIDRYIDWLRHRATIKFEDVP